MTQQNTISPSQHKPLQVLHLITEKTWRGGENQVRFLLEHVSKDVCWHVAAPKHSQASKRLSALADIVFLDTRGFGLVKSIIQLDHYLKVNGIKIIDCQTSKGHSLGLALKWLDKSRKLVVHRRVDFTPGNQRFSRRKYMSSLVDRYVAISDAIASILIDYGIAANKVTTVHSAVDDAPFTHMDKAHSKDILCKALGIDPRLPLISNVAYHTEQKGQDTLIKALAILKAQNISFHCVLAGEGHLTSKLKALTSELNLSSSVHFLGIRNDIADILAASDIFALPSNKEGLGTSLLDAAHAQCAIAASNIGGIPEIIIHEKTGLLSKVKDELGLSKNLAKLILDKDLAMRLARAAKTHAQDNFSVKQMAAGNLRVYQELIAQSSP